MFILSKTLKPFFSLLRDFRGGTNGLRRLPETASEFQASSPTDTVLWTPREDRGGDIRRSPCQGDSVTTTQVPSPTITSRFQVAPSRFQGHGGAEDPLSPANSFKRKVK